jgi:hypothetical protein
VNGTQDTNCKVTALQISVLENCDYLIFVAESTESWHITHHHHHHCHKHQGLGRLARSVSRVTAALASISLVSQLFSFLVDCSGMILKGFGIVAFFACVRASSFCIHLSCLVCIQSVVRGVWSRLSYGH